MQSILPFLPHIFPSPLPVCLSSPHLSVLAEFDECWVQPHSCRLCQIVISSIGLFSTSCTSRGTTQCCSNMAWSLRRWQISKAWECNIRGLEDGWVDSLIFDVCLYWLKQGQPQVGPGATVAALWFQNIFWTLCSHWLLHSVFNLEMKVPVWQCFPFICLPPLGWRAAKLLFILVPLCLLF